MPDNNELNQIEEAFWGKISDDDREQIAVQIAEQIVGRPQGLLSVGYLLPLASVFLEKVDDTQ